MSIRFHQTGSKLQANQDWGIGRSPSPRSVVNQWDLLEAAPHIKYKKIETDRNKIEKDRKNVMVLSIPHVNWRVPIGKKGKQWQTP